MDSSATSKRKLLPFIPDVPYNCQIVFIFTYGYIWTTAFMTPYSYADYPTDPEEQMKLNRANWWRAFYSVGIFMCAFNYLEPYHLDFFHPMQRFWRVVCIIGVMYFCFVIVMFNHHPIYGR
jgi:hypothetical protein